MNLIQKKEIQKPVSKESICTNRDTALQEKAKELAEVHYNRSVNDDYIKKFITDFPFREINQQGIK